MNDLLRLVTAKVQAATIKIGEGLQARIQAQKNENAAKGLLRSGATLKQILRYSSEALEMTREAITTECRQLITDSLWHSSGLTMLLLQEGQQRLKEIQAKGEAELKAATAMMRKDILYERLQKDLAKV